jgi:hypothetical protein
MVRLHSLLVLIINLCLSILDWALSSFAEYRNQLLALSIIPSALDLAVKAFAYLKVDLDEEKAAWFTAQIEVDVAYSGSQGPEDLC